MNTARSALLLSAVLFAGCAGDPFADAPAPAAAQLAAQADAGRDVEQLDALDVQAIDVGPRDSRPEQRQAEAAQADAGRDVEQLDAEPCSRYTCICEAGAVAFCLPACACVLR